MKKIIPILICCSAIFAFSSCKKESPILGAKVNVTVENMVGNLQEGRTVYMYKDSEITADTRPEDAHKQSVTNADGIAEFELNLTELNILESQTSLYFAVFYTVGGSTTVAGTSAITIKRNDVKSVTLTIPL